jgi:hypothetical protein
MVKYVLYNLLKNVRSFWFGIPRFDILWFYWDRQAKVIELGNKSYYIGVLGIENERND